MSPQSPTPPVLGKSLGRAELPGRSGSLQSANVLLRGSMCERGWKCLCGRGGEKSQRKVLGLFGWVFFLRRGSQGSLAERNRPGFSAIPGREQNPAGVMGEGEDKKERKRKEGGKKGAKKSMQHFPFSPSSPRGKRDLFFSPFLPTPLAPNLSSSSCLLLCKERSRLSRI